MVHQYETPECGERCYVALLDKYIAKLPPEAFDADVFYLRPADSLKQWYSRQPLGRNTLASMMKMMSKEAGLKGDFTNHSLQAYGASEMFQKSVSKKLIQQCTGHRSLEALRKYENASEMQVVKVSHALATSDGVDVLEKACTQPQVSQSAS